MNDKIYKIVKYLFLLILISWYGQMNLYAQKYRQVAKSVFLKDGSRLKGKIINTVPGEYISIMLSGGQVLKVYQQDIKKIKAISVTHSKSTYNKERGEIVYLKDGGNLYGKIIDEVPDDYIILKLKNDREITFFAEEIAQIKYNKRARRDFHHKESGYFHETDLGIMSGSENVLWANTVNFSVHTINGYRFKPWLQTGLGVGLDFHSNLHVVPFYLNIGGEMGSSRVVPIYFINLGYSYAEERNRDDFQVIDNVHGGKYFHLGGGIKVKMSGMAISMKMGYKLSDVELDNTFVDWLGRDSWTTELDRQIRRFTFTVGFGF